MSISKRRLFINSINNGDKEVFLSLLPKVKLSELGVKRILKKNMKLKHDFILKSLFLREFIWKPSFLEELLLAAIYHQYDLGVSTALIKGALPNGVLVNGKQPLIFAIKRGNMAAVKILLEHGADPNLKKDNYHSALTIALDNLDMELVELLQNNGALIEQKHLQSALATAAKANRFDLVDRFLLIGAQIQNSTYFGTTFVNPSVIPKLLKRDFTFNLCYEPIVNFFSLAARFGHLSTLQEFIKHGRHRTPEMELVTTLSDALVTAAGKGFEPIVQYLLGQGADINYIRQDKTAYDAALEAKHIKLANFLLKNGGKSASG